MFWTHIFCSIKLGVKYWIQMNKLKSSLPLALNTHFHSRTFPAYNIEQWWKKTKKQPLACFENVLNSSICRHVLVLTARLHNLQTICNFCLSKNVYSSSDSSEEGKSLKLLLICLITFFSMYLHHFKKHLRIIVFIFLESRIWANYY